MSFADATKPVSSPTLTKKHLLTLCFSNIVVCFNFLTYLRLSDTLNLVFFPPHSNLLVAQLQVLSVISSAFVARPIGALIIGRYGDIYGRKPALILSLALFVITATLTACLPVFAQVGNMATIFFVLIALLQGMVFGAYAPLGWVFISEYVPKHNLATYCGLLTASLAGGSFASILFTTGLQNTFTHSELVRYGWRIPFLVGGILSLMALLLMRSITETPLFLQTKQQRQPLSKYMNFDFGFILGFVFKRPQALLLAMMLSFISASLVIIVTLLLPTLITPYFHIDSLLLMFGNLIGLLFLIFGCLFFGFLAGIYGVIKSLLFGGSCLILQSAGFYYHLEMGDGAYILLMYALLGFFSGIISLCPTILVKLFATQTRLMSVSIVYNLIYAVAGGILPFGLVYGTHLFKLFPGIYLGFVGLMTITIGLYIHQSPLFKGLDDTANV